MSAERVWKQRRHPDISPSTPRNANPLKRQWACDVVPSQAYCVANMGCHHMTGNQRSAQIISISHIASRPMWPPLQRSPAPAPCCVQREGHGNLRGLSVFSSVLRAGVISIRSPPFLGMSNLYNVPLRLNLSPWVGVGVDARPEGGGRGTAKQHCPNNN